MVGWFHKEYVKCHRVLWLVSLNKLFSILDVKENIYNIMETFRFVILTMKALKQTQSKTTFITVNNFIVVRLVK